jgi:hypothetical protein
LLPPNIQPCCKRFVPLHSTLYPLPVFFLDAIFCFFQQQQQQQLHYLHITERDSIQIVSVLRGRAAENLLMRPPSPESEAGEANSTDKNNAPSSENTNKRPNTAHRSRRGAQNSSSSSNNNNKKGGNNTASSVAATNASRKGVLTPEEMAAERLEVERMVNDLDSLGPPDNHAVFRRIPPSNDTMGGAEEEEDRILQPQQHPFALVNLKKKNHFTLHMCLSYILLFSKMDFFFQELFYVCDICCNFFF